MKKQDILVLFIAFDLLNNGGKIPIDMYSALGHSYANIKALLIEEGLIQDAPPEEDVNEDELIEIED